jgi:hypothetical protein
VSNSTSSVGEIITNTKPLITSDSEVKNTNTRTLVEVRQIAQKLCDRLNNQSRFEYYCKVAWNLSDAKIWTSLETALTGQDPAKYFSFLTSMEMK